MSAGRGRGPRAIGNVPEGLPTEVTRFLEQIKRVVDDVLSGVVAESQISSGLLAPGSVGGVVVDEGGDPPPDTTPPPSPSDVTVGAGTDFIGIVTGNPTFTVGNGYFRTIVYGAKYSGVGPLPTFSAAAVVHEFVGQVGSFPINAGEQWHIWVAWRSRDGGTSPIVGGVNGFTALYGGPAWISSAFIIDLAVSKLTAGSLSVGEYIQSSGFVPGVTAGFRIDGNGGVEIRNADSSRVFDLGASGSEPVLQVPDFSVLANGSALFRGLLQAGTVSGALFDSCTINSRIDMGAPLALPPTDGQPGEIAVIEIAGVGPALCTYLGGVWYRVGLGAAAASPPPPPPPPAPPPPPPAPPPPPLGMPNNPIAVSGTCRSVLESNSSTITTASSRIIVRPTGIIDNERSHAEGVFTIGNWYTVPTAGIGNAYWVRVTKLTGSNSTSGEALGVWLPLTALRLFSWARSTYGSTSASIKVEISSSASGVPIVAASPAFTITAVKVPLV